jgi:hypothetical protein
MAAKLTRLTHKIAIQLHPVAESCTICSSLSRSPVRKLVDTPLYFHTVLKDVLSSSSPAVTIVETRYPDFIQHPG